MFAAALRRSTIPAPAAADPKAVRQLAKQVSQRLDELDISVQRAAQLGVLSRSTLQLIGQNDTVPTARTLSKFDHLLCWEPGSAAGVLAGKKPVPTPQLWMVENLKKYIHESLAEDSETDLSPADSRITSLGQDGRVPSLSTLSDIDRLMGWEPGSAAEAMAGNRPSRADAAPGVVPEGDPDTARLAEFMDARLDQLGLNRASAAEEGLLAYPTLLGIGRSAARPRPRTLAKLDQLLAWEAGSAQAVLFGGDPVPLEVPVAEEQEDLDPARLIPAIEARLPHLGLDKVSASELGLLSRGTLQTFGRENKLPRASTLAKIDKLCSWEPGSARAVMRGGQPTPRELAMSGTHDDRPMDDYRNLSEWIERRLRQLNISRTKFASLGGPGRTTLFELGRGGVTPSEETLARLDTTLLWESGSTAAVLRGGEPRPLNSSGSAHSSLIPLNAALTQLHRLTAKLTRLKKSVEVIEAEIEPIVSQVALALAELGGNPPRAGADLSSGHRRKTDEGWQAGDEDAGDHTD
ncbi:Uncharacterised protein [Mycobacteroides abscessus subsp. bolletii]|nr:Uncharacterised protein [Mycobacteroides abscessus subsp. bolletii]